MVCITNPWNLVIVVMMTIVAATAPSSDGTDVRSVTKDQPEPRHDSETCTRVTDDPVTNSKPPVLGNYEICVIMSPEHVGGTEGTVSIAAQYVSGRFGWRFAFPVGKTYVPPRSHRCYSGSHEYCEGDRVKRIFVSIYSEVTFDDNATCSCNWFPKCITINGPQEYDQYVCHWGEQCGCEHVGTLEFCPPRCTFGKTEFYDRAIECLPPNASNSCP